MTTWTFTYIDDERVIRTKLTGRLSIDPAWAYVFSPAGGISAAYSQHSLISVLRADASELMHGPRWTVSYTEAGEPWEITVNGKLSLDNGWAMFLSEADRMVTAALPAHAVTRICRTPEVAAA